MSHMSHEEAHETIMKPGLATHSPIDAQWPHSGALSAHFGSGVGVAGLPPGTSPGSSLPPGVVTVGSDSTVMPSAAEAAAAVPRLEESLVCTLAAVEAGTVIVAVMITLAAATVMTVDEGATPALAAIERRRAVVSE